MAATQLAVLATTVGTAAYWWLVLVPSERVSLAKNKRKGGPAGLHPDFTLWLL